MTKEELKEQNANLIAMLKSEREVRVNVDYLKGICERNAEIDKLKMGLKWDADNRDELLKENAELKRQQFTLRNERNTFLAQNEQYEKDLIDINENLTKAKEIIENLMALAVMDFREYEEAYKEAEQFLEEVKE